MVPFDLILPSCLGGDANTYTKMFYQINIIKFCRAKNDYRRGEADGNQDHEVLESFILAVWYCFS